MTNPTPSEPEPDEFRRLFMSCLDQIEREGEGVVDELCRQHPEHADTLRRRVQRLRDMGLLKQDDLQPGGAQPGGAQPGDLAPGDEFPERLGEFRLIRLLGGGGMGVVYLAEQEGLGRQVALKVIRPDQLFFPGTRDRFQREVATIARLQHPGIVPVYTVGMEGEIPYFAMERVGGCTLHEVLIELRDRDPARLTGGDLADAVRRKTASGDDATGEPDGTTGEPDGTTDESDGDTLGYVFAGTWEEACLRITQQVAEALDHAHRRGVVHRDIKPSNVMVTPSGRAMLLDFGLASSEGAHRLTRTGSAMGSLFYMSPEQCQANTDPGPRSDVYSLGVTLYEMLALQPPFRGDSTPEVMELIQQGRPEGLRDRNRAVSWESETVCQSAMDVDPDRRYASASELARDLDNVLHHRPIEARRAGTWLRLRRWVQRNPARSAASLLAALLVLGGPTVIAILESSARHRIQEKVELADANFEQALFAVDRMLTRVADVDLEQVPQMEKVRRNLYEDAVEFYRSLLRIKSDDVEVRRKTAVAHDRLGQLLSDLGRYDEALAAINESVAMFDDLIAAEPENPSSRLGFASILQSLSQLSDRAGRFADSEAAIARSTEILESLAAQSPDSIEIRRGLAMNHGMLAGLAHRSGDPAGATAAFEAAVQGLTELAKRDPDDAGTKLQLAQISEQFGLVLYQNLPQKLGPQPEAEAHLQRAVDLFDELARSDPDNAKYGFKLSTSLINLSGLWRRQGRLPDAESAIRRLIAALDRLSAQFPDTFKYERDLATVYNNLATVLFQSDRSEESDEAYDESVRLLRGLAARYPEEPELRTNLALGESNLAQRYLWRGEDPLAQPRIEAAIEHQLAACALSPDHVGYRARLAKQFEYATQILLRLGDEVGAIAIVAQLDELARRHPDEAALWGELSEGYVRLSKAARARSAFGEAKALIDQAIDADGRTVELDPDETTYRDRWAGDFEDLAEILLALDDPAGAIAAVERILEVCPDFWQTYLRAAGSLANCVAYLRAATTPVETIPAADELAERAVDHIRTAIELGCPQPARLWNMSVFQPLETSPSFQALRDEL